ncbi:flippase-like domain-containing protein [Bacteroidales bacterium OttesenSCG-928-L03]|nr:flippase-like domain-containing protein [Bacteroidales bacterium OttesenSCG-928-L03]
MSPKIKDILVKLLKTVIPLAFGILVFVLIFRTLDFHAIMNILRQDVNWWIIALSLPFGLGANIVRAYRWDLLIRPLGYKPKKSNLIYAVLGNYGVNMVFPRLGEVWRCTAIKQYEKIPFTKLFGTLITDRLADTVSVLTIVMASVILNLKYFKAFLGQHPDMFDKIYGLLTSVWLYVGIVGFVVAVWLFFHIFRNSKFMKKIKETLASLWEGIKTIGTMKEKRLFILYTVLIWLGYYLYFYICFYAFPFTRDLGWVSGLIAFGMSSVAVGIPVQGSIGTWHAMVIAVLMGFGLTATDAGAFAFCVHTVQQLIFTAAFGLFGVLALPIANRTKN